jgi:hypothetical protein
MIIVTGTKRSGTSLWMQILSAGGFPVVGAAFPGRWGESIRAANARGFYESLFRQGINWTTNPDPRTGAFVRPEEVTRHAVKVFAPGLTRTDLAYVGRVIVTVRHWREYAASLERLNRMEQDFFQRDDGGLGERDSPGERRVRGGRMSPILEWWFQNYELMRDIVTRGYPVHALTFDRLLADPEREIAGVFRWLGEGDLGTAAAAVAPELRTFAAPDVATGLSAGTLRVFDDYYAAVHAGSGLSEALVADMNEAYVRLCAEWDAERAPAAPTRDGAWGEPI